MNPKTNLLSSVILFTCVAACGGGPNPDQDALNSVSSEQKISQTKFEIIDGQSTLQLGAGNVFGSGLIRFAPALREVSSAHLFKIKFLLSESDLSQVTFFVHTDRSLRTGVEIRFERNQAKNTLDVFATANGNREDWSRFFTQIDVSQEVELGIDVHNNHGAYTHLIFWDENDGSADPILDSGVDVDGSPGRGHGANWGLWLQNSRVLSLTKHDARDAH
jgi:hypothetical protein